MTKLRTFRAQFTHVNAGNSITERKYVQNRLLHWTAASYALKCTVQELITVASQFTV